mmetsp:Transcript_36912/g.118566  ORF Transcript_36912/g.118566 Transcript_36912/m.118566 type:complete len:253 (-) Transcript_36912:71-829(-)
MSVAEVSDGPGTRSFCVVGTSRVSVRSAPSVEARALSWKLPGDRIVAETQTYDGWIRLAKDEGWILCFSDDEGPLVVCPLFVQDASWRSRRALGQGALQTAHARGANHAEELIQRVHSSVVSEKSAAVVAFRAGNSLETRLVRLRGALLCAKSFGIEDGEVFAAELVYEGLRRGWHPAGRAAARTAQLPTPACVAEPCADTEAATAALQRLAEAAASGDAAAAGRAREAAKRAGATRREIARVHALHCVPAS